MSELQESIIGLNEYIGAVESAIGASSFGVAGGVPNPNSVCSGGEITGGTFTTNNEVHSTLGNELKLINDNIIGSGITGAGLKQGSTEYKNIHATGTISKSIDNKLDHVTKSINERVQNILTLQNVLDSTFDNLINHIESSVDSVHASDIENIKFVKSKINDTLNNETQALQKVLKTQIKPSSESIKELVKKNATFSALAETLGIDYDTDEGSDRLAIAYTNLSNTGLAVVKLKDALNTLDMTVIEYSKIKNTKDLEDKITDIIKKVNKPGIKNKLSKILDAIQILRNNQYKHSEVIECLKDTKNCLKIGHSEDASNSDDITGENEYSTNQLGRVKKFNTKSTLSRNIKIYEKTLKELFKSFMSQINSNFKEIHNAVENVVEELGESIMYDEKIKNFISIFESIGQDMDNSKLFYSLISFDETLPSKELKSRFLNNLDKSIESLNNLKSYKYLNEIKKQLENVKETIDTYSDTVTGFKSNEIKIKDDKLGGGNLIWTDKLLEKSVTLNVSKLIKETITKLRFYGNISQMKSSLSGTLQEFTSYKEDYDKLLGKSIGTKINELTREYTENIDRLNNIECNRGLLLHIWNKDNKGAEIPKGLIETVYKLQYDAKIGLYKTIEAIDIYLMNFTELLSGNVEATRELNKMLQQTEVIAKWYNKNSGDKLFKLMEKIIYADTDNNINNVKTFITGKDIKEVLELCKESIDSVSMLKNILSMFVHIGDKFGNKSLSKEMYMSPNIMYKNLIKYIWVSAFTMGYGTGGGDVNTIINNNKKDKNGYEKETGTKESYFNVHFTQLVNSRQQSAAILGETVVSALTPINTITQTTVVDNSNKPTDIFETDDIYFVLVMKAITAKILTVIGTSHILKQPKTVVGLITNPVRSILGGAKDPEVIDEAFELYIRLPLLVEFYKHVFEDGNRQYKRNKNADDATETIAYIPEIGSIWSGLIQCIFDEARYIKDGIYSIDNMKRIISEVNNIYKKYKNVDKNKLVKTAVLDLIADVNKRYGILKKQEIDEFYQLKKRYVNHADESGINTSHVNFDILDENNEFEDVGPSSKYTEHVYSKTTNDSIITNDIKLVKEFHNKIHKELFSQKNKLKSLDKVSFSEKIKFYKNELQNNTNNAQKLDIIIKAIDDSSNINSHNDDVSILFHELVAAPIKNLQAIHNIIDTMFEKYLPKMYSSLPADEQTEYNNYIEAMKDDNLKNILKNTTGSFNKMTLIEFLYSYLCDIDNLASIKFINNNKFIIDYSKLQRIVENSIENVKYMLSKFRNQLPESTIKIYETCILNLEDKLLLKIINSDDNNVDAKYDLYNFDYMNSTISYILKNTENTNLFNDLYSSIMYNTPKKEANVKLSNKATKIWNDIFAQYGGSKNKLWIPLHKLGTTNEPINNGDFSLIDDLYGNLDSLSNSSILYGFNSLVYEYLCTFYDASTKKIYNNLFNEFVTKSQSSVIFGRNGIPDIQFNVDNKETNCKFIKDDYILCESLGYMFKTIINRTTNIQLPIKNHLLLTLSEVSPNVIEKYKVYLPIFIKLFETLIHKSLLCKKVLETTINTELLNGNSDGVDVLGGTDRSIEGDLPGDLQKFESKWQNGNKLASIHFNNTLNSVIEASRALINDANVVLSEINVKQQFFEIKENSIKNFFNNNNQLPLMPLSLNTVILNNDIYKDSKILVPYPNKQDTEFKLLYGINSVINNTSLDNNINSYIWLKEEIKNYNNSALSINKLDVNKVNEYIEINNKLSISLSSLVYYNQFLNKDKTNKLFKFNNTNDECSDVKTYYTSISSVLNNTMDTIENTSIMNTRNKIASVIKSSNSSLDISRVNARFLNILDLNIVPLNIHALMREIPLTNIYNYAFTYDHIVKQLFNQEYDYTFNDTTPNTCDELLLKLFLNPYYKKCDNDNLYLNALLGVSSDNDSSNSKLGRSKYISDILSHAIGAPDSKYKFTNKNNDKENVDATRIDAEKNDNKMRLHNKYFRNLIFLTNIQRLIHYKIKHEVEIINSKVVSDMAIANSQIVNYNDEHPNLEETDFEYLMTDD